MAESDRPDDAPPRPRKRRRKPPLLDLEAKEVGGGEAEAQAQRSDSPKGSGTGSSRPSGELDWRGLAANPFMAGAVGLVAGALVVYLLIMSRGEVIAPRDDALKNEIARLSERVEALAARPPATASPDFTALGTRIDRLTAAIGDAEKRLAAVENRPPAPVTDLSGVRERTAAIESAIEELHGTLAELRRMAEQAPPAASPGAVEAIANRIGGLEQRIAALASSRTAATDTSTAAEIAALNALADAIRSGKPFVRELEAARVRLGERAAPLAALDAHAERGLPTTAALEERFSEIVPAILRGPEPEGGFFSRMYGNAARLVQVRPVGEPKGTELGAVVARMEAKLARGDLAGALAESDLLSDAGKAAAAAWLAAARQRYEAELTIKRLMDALLADHAESGRP